MKSIETRRKKQLKLTIQYKQTAQNGLKEIELNSSLKKLICSLLFWCEGAKQRDRVQFINSDPILVKIFVSLLRESYELDEKKFRVLMHLHDYHDEERQKNFWSNATGIPPTQFTKTYWKKNTGKRRREQYPGCIRVSYYDAEIAQQLYAWYNVLAKVIGSDI